MSAEKTLQTAPARPTLQEIRAAARNDIEISNEVREAIMADRAAWLAFNDNRPKILRKVKVAEDPTNRAGWIYKAPLPE